MCSTAPILRPPRLLFVLYLTSMPLFARMPIIAKRSKPDSARQVVATVGASASPQPPWGTHAARERSRPDDRGGWSHTAAEPRGTEWGDTPWATCGCSTIHCPRLFPPVTMLITPCKLKLEDEGDS